MKFFNRKLICPQCGKKFTVADRNTAVTERDAEDTIYCSYHCQRAAQNRRNYLRRVAQKVGLLKD